MNGYVPWGYHPASGVALSNARKAQGLPCQDVAFAGFTQSMQNFPYPPNLCLGIIADGAGSAPMALEGATCAVATMHAALGRNVGAITYPMQASEWALSEALRKAFFEVRDALQELARTERRPVHDFATTLLCFVWDPSLGTAFLQIGDGAIVTGPPWTLKFKPHKGASREVTSFVTDDDAPTRVMISHGGRKPIPHNVVMFSDGLEDLLIERPSLAVFPPFFDWLAANNKNPKGTNLSPLLDRDELRESTSDDMALVALSLDDKWREQHRP